MVDYPKTLELRVDRESTYNVTIDLSGAPLPPEQAIRVPSGTATSDKIQVKCGVAARLVPEGQLTTDPDEEHWTIRAFGPEGRAQWRWAVSTPTTYGNELTLEIQPAQLGDQPAVLTGTHTVQLFTDVQVNGTWIDRASDWFAFQWPKLKAMFVIVGTAIVLVGGWAGWKLIGKGLERVRSQTQASAPAPATNAAPPGAGTSTGPGTPTPNPPATTGTTTTAPGQPADKTPTGTT